MSLFQKRSVFSTALSLSVVMGIAAPGHAQQQVERPPQFILMSFDGSYNLGTWKKLRDFSKSQEQNNRDSRFTFFMSGVYFIQPQNRTIYQPPKHGIGKSDIGVGDNSQDIALRVDQVNAAVKEGHEMGSHANGHFDGSSWTEAEWDSEFSQFSQFIFDVFNINKISTDQVKERGWLLKKDDLKGFRAPLLGVSKGLWPTMQKHQFAYDCSKIAPANYWPEKTAAGLWNFPLAELKIAGTSKKTLSMDYNFYVAQSSAKADVANKELYKNQMYDTYINWFQSNYNGNRAPLNIGHHFSAWNGGAYMESLMKFAQDVCGLPEVQCVTYTEYTHWLENLAPATLAQYRKGQFERVPSPIQIAQTAAAVSTQVTVGLSRSAGEKFVFVRPLVPEQQMLKDFKVQLTVNGNRINRSSLWVKEVQRLAPGSNQVAITAHLLNRSGQEIARSTQMLHDLQAESQLSQVSLESTALKGDLPEAHMDERENGF